MMTVLFIGAHMDDIELSCGGTINRLINEGVNVVYIGLSPCHNPIKLEVECFHATAKLGIKRKNVKTFALPVRDFVNHRQDIADIVIRAIKEYSPKAIVTHHLNDRHPDHRTTAEAVIRVANCTVFSFCAPHNRIDYNENVIVRLNWENIDAKIKSLACYKSQSEREYVDSGFIMSWALATGIQTYAEGFEIIKIIL